MSHYTERYEDEMKPGSVRQLTRLASAMHASLGHLTSTLADPDAVHLASHLLSSAWEAGKFVQHTHRAVEWPLRPIGSVCRAATAALAGLLIEVQRRTAHLRDSIPPQKAWRQRAAATLGSELSTRLGVPTAGAVTRWGRYFRAIEMVP